jgi:hypothetical protein
MQIDPGTIVVPTNSTAPSGSQVKDSGTVAPFATPTVPHEVEAIVAGITNVDGMQIDPGTIAVPTTSKALSGLQVKYPGTVAPLATPTMPQELEVISIYLSLKVHNSILDIHVKH